MTGFGSLIRLLLPAVGSLLGTLPARAADVEPTPYPLLWRIETEPPSWLFGTIHLGDPRVLALSTAVEDALYGSDAVFTELPMGGSLMSGMARHIFLPPDQTLEDVLPAKLHARLQAYLKSRGSPKRLLERMQIWGVVMTLGTLDFADAMAAGQPLDAWLWDEGRAMGLEVGGLEFMEEQVHAFGNFTSEEQVELLRQTLDKLEEALGEDTSESIIQAYLDGRVDEMMEVMEVTSGADADTDELSKRLQTQLLDERNQRMTERITLKLRQSPGKQFFFAVGAAHMPGEQGLVELLRQQGFGVTRINAPPPLADDEESDDLRSEVERLRNELRDLKQRLRKLERQHGN